MTEKKNIYDLIVQLLNNSGKHLATCLYVVFFSNSQGETKKKKQIVLSKSNHLDLVSCFCCSQP